MVSYMLQKTKKSLSGLLCLFLILFANKQMIAKIYTLEECISQAKNNSPLIKQSLYYNKMDSLEKQNIAANYLPTILLDAQATYQSDVFKLPITIPVPGFTMPEIPKDQYQLSLNINQTIWDGGLTSSSEKIQDIEKSLQLANIDLSMFKLNEIINKLYFGILYYNSNIKILQSSLEDLTNKKKQIKINVENGVSTNKVLNSFEIEILKLKQKIDAMNYDKNSLIKTLRYWIGESKENNVFDESNETIEFTEPNFQETFASSQISRPEITIMEINQSKLEANKELVSTSLAPKFSAFAKLGYGNPNILNSFKDGFSEYYQVGLKMQWLTWNWNTNARKEENLELNKLIIEQNKKDFEKSITSTLIQEKSDFEKYAQQMKQDKEIIALQEQVSNQTFTQVQNGTATSNEYFTDNNSLNIAKINYEIHRLQELNAIVNFKIKNGTFPSSK